MNAYFFERLCRRNDAELAVWAVDPRSGELSLDDLRGLLDERVKVVCMTHSSNIIGSVNPVEEGGGLCRGHGGRVLIDGVSYAPHQWPDLPALQPDAYCFSADKTYATHLGVMYKAPGFAETLEPQCHYFNRG
ncbi:MAG: aminotransferase class V-fold PLP-dependent enzyme, partial [Gammaproteobacteria bacterium]|nr:aminotransferase class V-fold PLP-dependent enzyme [Gammaproteobacteria bacterium]